MSVYEDLVRQMRRQGKYYNAEPVTIGVVSSKGKIKIDNNELEPDDYLINCNLRLDDEKKIYLHTAKPMSGEYMSDSEHNRTLEEYKENVLKKGDKVLLVKLYGKEKYVLIAKVVEPK